MKNTFRALAGVPGFTATVVLTVASYLPARRASAVDPAEAFAAE